MSAGLHLIMYAIRELEVFSGPGATTMSNIRVRVRDGGRRGGGGVREGGREGRGGRGGERCGISSICGAITLFCRLCIVMQWTHSTRACLRTLVTFWSTVSWWSRCEFLVYHNHPCSLMAFDASLCTGYCGNGCQGDNGCHGSRK